MSWNHHEVLKPLILAMDLTWDEGCIRRCLKDTKPQSCCPIESGILLLLNLHFFAMPISFSNGGVQNHAKATAPQDLMDGSYSKFLKIILALVTLPSSVVADVFTIWSHLAN